MWVRTQDKKALVNIIGVEISSIFGYKRKGVVVWGRFAPQGLFSSNGISLGIYSTMDDAIAEIDEIEKCILNNPNGVYTMKSSE